MIIFSILALILLFYIIVYGIAILTVGAFSLFIFVDALVFFGILAGIAQLICNIL